MSSFREKPKLKYQEIRSEKVKQIKVSDVKVLSKQNQGICCEVEGKAKGKR